MGAIGKWIDARCAEEPEVMRRVLNRKFGPLNHFVSADDKCGCLVGSWLIESHQLPAQRGPKAGTLERKIGLKVYGMVYYRPRISEWGISLLNNRRRRSEGSVVRLVKQRIRKALGLTPILHHEEEELACHS